MEYYEQRHRLPPEHVQPRPLRGVPTRPILPTHRKTGGPRVRTPRPNLEADRDAAISSPEVGAVRTLPRKLRRQGDEFRRRGTHAAQSLVLFAYAGRLSPLPLPPSPRLLAPHSASITRSANPTRRPSEQQKHEQLGNDNIQRPQNNQKSQNEAKSKGKSKEKLRAAGAADVEGSRSVGGNHPNSSKPKRAKTPPRSSRETERQKNASSRNPSGRLESSHPPPPSPTPGRPSVLPSHPRAPSPFRAVSG